MAAGKVDEAIERFNKAQDLAQEDKRLRAETEGLKANHYRAHRNPRLELRALRESGPCFEAVGDHQLAGRTFERTAELEGNTRSRLTLRRAYDAYCRAKDHVGAGRVLDRARMLGVNVGTWPILDKPSTPQQSLWPWLRWSVEVLIVAAAVYMMFMR